MSKTFQVLKEQVFDAVLLSLQEWLRGKLGNNLFRYKINFSYKASCSPCKFQKEKVLCGILEQPMNFLREKIIPNSVTPSPVNRVTGVQLRDTSAAKNKDVI